MNLFYFWKFLQIDITLNSCRYEDVINESALSYGFIVVKLNPKIRKGQIIFLHYSEVLTYFLLELPHSLSLQCPILEHFFSEYPPYPDLIAFLFLLFLEDVQDSRSTYSHLVYHFLTILLQLISFKKNIDLTYTRISNTAILILLEMTVNFCEQLSYSSILAHHQFVSLSVCLSEVHRNHLSLIVIRYVQM